MEMQIKKSGTMTTQQKPDIAVLDKTFEILKKAGFPQEALDEAYEDLCECCNDTESETETESMDKPSTEVQVEVTKSASKPTDMKSEMMDAMKSIIEKLSK